jgi:hypothetical protein
MFASLVRLVKRQRAEIGAIGLLVAAVIIIHETVERVQWFSIHLPWLADELGKGIRVVHLIDASFVFLVLVVVLALRFYRGKPPMGHVSVLHFLLRPDAPNPAAFQFRVPRSELDLEPFVEFSDAEVNIASRHHELSGKSRRDLYRRWFGIRKQSFLILDSFDPASSKWSPIAVSIVLPLTDAGYQKICDKLVRIIDLADGDVARDGTASTRFLVDTWIVKQKGKAKFVDKPIREPTEKYSMALLYAHLGVFWTGRSRAILLVEADHPKIMHICDALGFDKSRRTRDGAVLQCLSYPDDAQAAEVRRALETAVKNLIAMRQWPILGYRP